jgi:hypothetical protein
MNFPLAIAPKPVEQTPTGDTSRGWESRETDDERAKWET